MFKSACAKHSLAHALILGYMCYICSHGFFIHTKMIWKYIRQFKTSEINNITNLKKKKKNT
jgi:hypothetical protein